MTSINRRAAPLPRHVIFPNIPTPSARRASGNARGYPYGRRTLVCALAWFAAPLPAADLDSLQVQADAIAAPLTATPGNPIQGRELLVRRENANCILCHAIPDVRFSGDLAPTLAGVGARLTPAQLRLRVADNARVYPNTIMPAYYRSAGLRQVAAQYRGKTILSAQEIEDVVAYLGTLK